MKTMPKWRVLLCVLAIIAVVALVIVIVITQSDKRSEIPATVSDGVVGDM